MALIEPPIVGEAVEQQPIRENDQAELSRNLQKPDERSSITKIVETAIQPNELWSDPRQEDENATAPTLLRFMLENGERFDFVVEPHKYVMLVKTDRGEKKLALNFLTRWRADNRTKRC
jgi:hypothetical protein